MNTIDKAENALLHTYNRYGIVWDHGDGVRLYDTDGKEYLDFVAGIAVFALGYNNKSYNDALKAQIDKIIHVSNYFYTEPMADAAERITKTAGMDRVFFTNSGAEAIEGAIKNARRYYYNKHGVADSQIIAMNNSFHGRTMGALSVTGNVKYREPFEPLIGGVVFAEYNNFESVRAAVNDKTCAIILETLQGEGGIRPAEPEFLRSIRQLCDDNDILLILDEIQCGMGRTGSMFCYQSYGINPDIVTCAKALGCGVPVGAFMTNEKCAALGAGDHGSTYGGNPLVTAAINNVLDQYEKLNILEHVKDVGRYMYEELDRFASKHSEITDHRGCGLMQGLELKIPAKDIILKAMENGLVLINAGNNIIRFIPPLIIEKKHVDEMILILERCFE